MMNLMWNETIFTFPFSYKGGLRKWKKHFEAFQLGQYWNLAKDIDSKYYLRHIYNDENRPLHYEYRSGSLGWSLQEEVLVKTSLTGDESMTQYGVRLEGLSLFVFPTGVGFITLRIRYGEDANATEIANFAAAFSRIFANEKKDGTGKIICSIDGQVRVLSEGMQLAVGVGRSEQIWFFPCTNNKKAFVFHRLIQDALKEKEKMALRRNLWVSDTAKDLDSITELEEIKQIDDTRYYMLSATVMCVVSERPKQLNSETRMRQLNIRFSYFNLFLLCIHEQQGVMLYNQEEVAIGKQIVHAKKIKKDLLRFLPSYSFRVVSTEIVYQQIFLSLQRILHLKELEENLRENISMLESAYEQRRDKRMNALLVILAILGVISAVADLLQVISYF